MLARRADVYLSFFGLVMIPFEAVSKVALVRREMAAEWLRLAEAIRRSRRSKQMQMG